MISLPFSPAYVTLGYSRLREARFGGRRQVGGVSGEEKGRGGVNQMSIQLWTD
jgi:hypothetical protein